ncbi:MAG: neutral zinc metallopeptidase [Isosphaeraceae bacterium]
MRWRGERQSDNVEDQRSVSPQMAVAGGGVGTLLIIILALVFGIDPRQALQQANQGAPVQAPAGGGPDGPGAQRPVDPAEEEAKQFVSVVLAETEDVWNELFKDLGRSYEEPKLVLFSGNVRSACGFASSAVGPFYCPGDSKVYLDLSFFDELKRRFKAPGEFAQAYVVAHEIGHHVQNLMGTSAKVDRARRRMSEAEANALSVRLELQADFLAGVWAHHAQKMKNILERGDVEAALRAATAIGDDKIQMQARGYVVPDSFTHGSSEQRVRWFRKGLQTGDVKQGDTFSVPDL